MSFRKGKDKCLKKISFLFIYKCTIPHFLLQTSVNSTILQIIVQFNALFVAIYFKKYIFA